MAKDPQRENGRISRLGGVGNRATDTPTWSGSTSSWSSWTEEATKRSHQIPGKEISVDHAPWSNATQDDGAIYERPRRACRMATSRGQRPQTIPTRLRRMSTVYGKRSDEKKDRVPGQLRVEPGHHGTSQSWRRSRWHRMLLWAGWSIHGTMCGGQPNWSGTSRTRSWAVSTHHGWWGGFTQTMDK